MAGARFVTLTPISLTVSTPVALGASSVVCSTVVMQAASANTGICYWGASNVATTNGISLAPGEKVAVTYDLSWGNNTFIPLDTIFIVGGTSEKVRVTYEQVN